MRSYVLLILASASITMRMLLRHCTITPLLLLLVGACASRGEATAKDNESGLGRSSSVARSINLREISIAFRGKQYTIVRQDALRRAIIGKLMRSDPENGGLITDHPRVERFSTNGAYGQMQWPFSVGTYTIDDDVFCVLIVNKEPFCRSLYRNDEGRFASKAEVSDLSEANLEAIIITD